MLQARFPIHSVSYHDFKTCSSVSCALFCQLVAMEKWIGVGTLSFSVSISGPTSCLLPLCRRRGIRMALFSGSVCAGTGAVLFPGVLTAFIHAVTELLTPGAFCVLGIVLCLTGGICPPVLLQRLLACLLSISLSAFRIVCLGASWRLPFVSPFLDIALFVTTSSNIRPRHRSPYPGSSSRNLSLSVCLSCLSSSVLSLWNVEQNKSVQRDERHPSPFFGQGLM